MTKKRVYREKKNMTNSFTPCSVSYISYLDISYPIALSFTLYYIISYSATSFIPCPISSISYTVIPWFTPCYITYLLPCHILYTLVCTAHSLPCYILNILFLAVHLLPCHQLLQVVLVLSLQKWGRYICLAYFSKHW